MKSANPTLGDVIDRRTTEGELYERMENNGVRCFACGHLCRIPEGMRGICKVRYNQGGVLKVPRGYVAALQVDPIEKKPFFHAYPGARALSFGMLGCDYHCGYCQNWVTSQALRDPVSGVDPREMEPEDLVRLAKKHGARVITSTYNEPLITSEWAVEVFKVAKREGLICSYVSNGNGTPQVLDYIQPYVDLYKIDLKGFTQKTYRELGGQLDPVLDTIRGLKSRGIWLEIVTLVVPELNDSDEELTGLAEFLASVDRDIPWHVTAFHQDYKMTANPNTSVSHLLRAYEIGRKAGLRYIYPGNIPGAVGDLESTHCPSCEEVVVERIGFQVLGMNLNEGKCPSCATVIPGVWGDTTSTPPRSRLGRVDAEHPETSTLISIVRHRMTEVLYVPVARTEEIPAGGMKAVKVEDRTIVLYHTASGFFASDDRCPHRGGPLVEGDLMGEEIICPWHLWSFNVTTGEGPVGPEVCLTTHEVRIEEDRILVKLAPRPAWETL